MEIITVAVLTISDRSSRKEREDVTGPKLIERIAKLHWILSDYAIVPDEKEAIQNILLDWSDSKKINIILTTGGTGFSPRDITPEATREIITKFAPGLSETMRAKGIKNAPHAMLSRGVSGIRHESIIINLPGSPKGALENLSVIEDVLPHARKILLNKPEAESEHE